MTLKDWMPDNPGPPFFGLSRAPVSRQHDRFKKPNFAFVSPKTYSRLKGKTELRVVIKKRAFRLDLVPESMCSDDLAYVFYRRQYVGAFKVKIK